MYPDMLVVGFERHLLVGDCYCCSDEQMLIMLYQFIFALLTEEPEGGG